MLTTVSDRKIGVYSGGSLTLPNDTVVAVVDYYEPHMVNATDYYAFGMPSRIASSATGAGYRFGFNGQENDNEIKGFGNMTSAAHWEYDARIGRRWNIDPVYKHSPYEVFGGNPILYADPEGADTIDVTRTTVRRRYGSMGGGLDGIAPKRTPDFATYTGNINIQTAEGNDVFRVTEVDITIDDSGNETRKSTTTTLNLNNEQTFYRSGGHNMKGYIDDRYALAAHVPGWLLNYYADKSGDIGVKSAIAYQKTVPFAAGLEKITNAVYTVSGFYGVFRFSLSKMAVQAATKEASGFVNEAINLTTSSKSTLPSRVYTIYDGSGRLFKFGVTDAALIRYNQSILEAGPGAYGKYSSIMPKNQAHLMEKYLRSLQYNSTGQYTLPGMKVPFPADFKTGKRIKP